MKQSVIYEVKARVAGEIRVDYIPAYTEDIYEEWIKIYKHLIDEGHDIVIDEKMNVYIIDDQPKRKDRRKRANGETS